MDTVSTFIWFLNLARCKTYLFTSYWKVFKSKDSWILWLQLMSSKSRKTEKKKEREVTVTMPSTTPLEESEIIKDTIEEERRNVFRITRKIGRSMSGLMITVGFLLTFLTLQYIFEPLLDIPGFPNVKSIITVEAAVIASGILGLINIICGFILLAKE